MQADLSVLEQNKSVLICFRGFENTVKKKSLTESFSATYFPFCRDFVCFGLGKRGRRYWDLRELASFHLNDSPYSDFIDLYDHAFSTSRVHK